MQIAYAEFTLEEILNLYATGLKVKEGDKIIRTEWFLDSTKNKVLHRMVGRRVLRCGWCGEVCTTYHEDWIHNCKVCHPCYLQFEKHLRESSNDTSSPTAADHD